jgi:cyclophilin family peptidyl-prolyl cis-trans isomerase
VRRRTTRRRGALAAAWLLAAGLGRAAPPAASAEEGATGAPFEVPTGIPIALDGLHTSGEWDDAAVCPTGVPGVALRAKQYRSSLLLALATDRAWPTRGTLLFFGRSGEGTGGVREPGTVRVDFEPYEHDRPHAMATVQGPRGEERRDREVVVRAGNLATAATLEAAIPLSLLGVRDAKPRAVRWTVAVVRPGLVPKTVTFPAGLDVGARVGAPPPDLASSSRWAQGDAWPGAGGPPAFSKTEWTALTAADAETWRRGEAAHALAHALRGDDLESPAERPKRDATIEANLLANLRWIAAREPLTPTDVRATAIGLWRLNRADEALAALEASAGPRLGGDADDLQTRARIALDAERYEEAADALDRLAARVPDPLGSPHRSGAAAARAVLPAWLAEQEARRRDAKRDDLPLALLSTSKGDVLLTLLEDEAPNAVRNFVHLAEGPPEVGEGKPFYDGTRFHRVVANGLVQGGDPTSRADCAAAGAGGCPWWIERETGSRRGFFRGAVAFATGDGKVRSQFFVLTAPRPELAERGFSVFATVRAGMDVVDRLEACDTLVSVRILRKRAHAYVPSKKT